MSWNSHRISFRLGLHKQTVATSHDIVLGSASCVKAYVLIKRCGPPFWQSWSFMVPRTNTRTKDHRSGSVTIRIYVLNTKRRGAVTRCYWYQTKSSAVAFLILTLSSEHFWICVTMFVCETIRPSIWKVFSSYRFEKLSYRTLLTSFSTFGVFLGFFFCISVMVISTTDCYRFKQPSWPMCGHKASILLNLSGPFVCTGL